MRLGFFAGKFMWNFRAVRLFNQFGVILKCKDISQQFYLLIKFQIKLWFRIASSTHSSASSTPFPTPFTYWCFIIWIYFLVIQMFLNTDVHFFTFEFRSIPCSSFTNSFFETCPCFWCQSTIHKAIFEMPQKFSCKFCTCIIANKMDFVLKLISKF